MNFKCQENSILQLDDLSNYDRHSVLIEGPSGCGKTYLANMYARKCRCEDILRADPNVQSVRSTLEACYNIEYNVAVCIENLDSGVPAASYALLKFLEEPRTNVYIIVTCANIKQVPDTIVSRSAVVSVGPPIDSDIALYGSTKDDTKYKILSKDNIWKCVSTFKDVDSVFNMTVDQISYFEYIQSSLMKFKDSISNLVWSIGHYKDGSETPLDMVIRYILCNTNDDYIRRSCISCMKDLSTGRIAKHAVLSKFVFECKYGQ